MLGSTSTLQIYIYIHTLNFVVGRAHVEIEFILSSKLKTSACRHSRVLWFKSIVSLLVYCAYIHRCLKYARIFALVGFVRVVLYTVQYAYKYMMSNCGVCVFVSGLSIGASAHSARALCCGRVRGGNEYSSSIWSCSFTYVVCTQTYTHSHSTIVCMFVCVCVCGTHSVLATLNAGGCGLAFRPRATIHYIYTTTAPRCHIHEQARKVRERIAHKEVRRYTCDAIALLTASP